MNYLGVTICHTAIKKAGSPTVSLEMNEAMGLFLNSRRSNVTIEIFLGVRYNPATEEEFQDLTDDIATIIKDRFDAATGEIKGTYMERVMVPGYKQTKPEPIN